MAKYQCSVCGEIYDEDIEKVKFEDLPDDWVCHLCRAPKSAFVLMGSYAKNSPAAEVPDDPKTAASEVP